MKILIIDDNQSVRVSLKMVLGGEFDNILAIGDPRLLPAILANGDFDAVLLDMNIDNSRDCPASGSGAYHRFRRHLTGGRGYEAWRRRLHYQAMGQ